MIHDPIHRELTDLRSEVHGWAKRGRPQRWTARRQTVTLADFDAVPIVTLADPFCPHISGDSSIETGD